MSDSTQTTCSKNSDAQLIARHTSSVLSFHTVSHELLEPLNLISQFEEYRDTHGNSYKYRNPNEYWLLFIGYAIGFGSFWRFPYFVFASGGGVFFIPYLIFFFLIGIPTFTLESALGQIFKRGPVDLFSMINKKFAGVGWTAVFTCFIISTYLSVLLSWSVYYFFLSFCSPLPWSKSDYDESNSINLSYFRENILKISKGIDEIGGIDYSLLVCLVIAYLLIFFVISRGIQSSSRVTYFSAPAPIAMLFILFVKSISLPGFEIGLQYMFIPDFSKLLDLSAWIRASNQVAFTLSLGLGENILFTSYRKDSENIFTSSVWIPLFSFFCGLLCSLISCCYLGHISYVMNIPISQLPLRGSELAFIIYPAALCTLPYPNLWSILFFFMLITLGIESMFVFYEAISYYVYESIFQKKVTKENSVMMICLAGFFLSLPFITNGGFFLVELVDKYATIISALVVLLLECFLVSKYIGVNVLKDMIFTKTQNTIPDYIFTSLTYICPWMLSALILLAIITECQFSPDVGLSSLLVQWIILILPAAIIAYFYITGKNDYTTTEDNHHIANCNQIELVKRSYNEFK